MVKSLRYWLKEKSLFALLSFVLGLLIKVEYIRCKLLLSTLKLEAVKIFGIKAYNSGFVGLEVPYWPLVPKFAG